MTYHFSTSMRSYTAQRQTIQAIEFIKDWSLCPHLACVVQCLAKTARKDSALEREQLYHLKMAEGHLIRKITANDVPTNYMIRISSSPMMPQTLSHKWDLSTHLQEVLFYVTAFQRLFNQFPRTRKILLQQALKHLREEFKTYEFLADFNSNLTTKEII